ncbi:MAG: phosphate ABC transporter permease PstA [Candidatus Competibacterales bacterium]|nr:phosphate ABC transporter permease PstA [Candidatus Competibacterales bacterium]
MSSESASARSTSERLRAGLERRHRAERRFRRYGLVAICLGLAFVALLFVDIISKGYSAFWQTYIQLDISFSEQVIDPQGSRDPETLRRADYESLIRDSLRETFPGVEGRTQRRALNNLISYGAAFELRDRVLAEPELIGTTRPIWLIADGEIDSLIKGHIDRSLPEAERPVSDLELQWVDQLREADRIEQFFNTGFFTNGDSREPELAGIRGALLGSFYTLSVTLVLSFLIGVAAAIYLEEFAPKNRWTDMIEVNINNLAAVPSIVFGLLGLAVFINFFGLPRSVPVVGGLVLTLMTLPTIIIASRAALKSVPPSIREAALGMGASRMQMIFHHVLPLALPGMLTGTIIGMAQALGETAPLLLIGMVAFIADIPSGPLDPATVMPVQIFLWSDLPERAFVERTSAAIIVLLTFLIAMNALAVILRKRFERRW